MDSKQVFLVGCPRSGTTLLQSMLASHSQVVSFPETHFFSETLPINPLLRRLKLHGKSSRQQVQNFLQKNSYSHLNPFEHESTYKLYSHHRWCQKLGSILDAMIAHEARNATKEHPVWGLEKTPRHLYYISSIKHANSSNKFLHILRKGRDVVASMHLATKNYPDQWDGVRSVEKCIKWWNNCISESLKYQTHPNHHFVVYDQLLKDPEKVLKITCAFLRLGYQQSMIDNFHTTADSLINEEEKWKQKNATESLQKSNKLDNNFEDSTIKYIEEHLTDIDLSRFYH